MIVCNHCGKALDLDLTFVAVGEVYVPDMLCTKAVDYSVERNKFECLDCARLTPPRFKAAAQAVEKSMWTVWKDKGWMYAYPLKDIGRTLMLAGDTDVNWVQIEPNEVTGEVDYITFKGYP